MSDTTNNSGVIQMPPDYEDPFARKPGSKRRVECLHCYRAFTEDQIQYGVKPSVNPHESYW